MAAALATPAVHAQPPDLRTGLIAASCNACHGPAGDSIAGMPTLAGRAAQELAALLLDFKSGRRPSTVMHRHAKGYSEDELRHIAEEFARQSSASRPQR